ncbi:hypothetical protein [Clostridium sp. C8-1-8]|uniref:hypothetical protein n=1 Tax=Clostridium sp. C8-1-8 TaxID=2698831 RepID=UPI001368A4FC|nr:hypothetical protein [Clostridium sp. C8-1-8]
MAIIDYGTVVKKNGLIIQGEMFMDMQKAVGFTIDKLYHAESGGTIQINDNFFAYIGDEDLLVCIYKTQLFLIADKEIKKVIWYGTDEKYNKLPYSKCALRFEFKGVKFHIKRLFGHNRYKLRFWYKGDLYECLYGYGVDVNKDKWYNLKSNERNFIHRWFTSNV